MNEVYINAKKFRNDTFFELFGKDLISVGELVDKIYDLNDELEEAKERLDEVREELRMTERELSSFKNGYRPDEM